MDLESVNVLREESCSEDRSDTHLRQDPEDDILDTIVTDHI